MRTMCAGGFTALFLPVIRMKSKMDEVKQVELSLL